MKNRRKRRQREEVRKILHAMRLELAAQRLSQEQGLSKSTVLRLNELVAQVKQTVAR